MDSFLITLPAIALAELGDKTQLVVLYLAARFKRPGAILAGLVVGATANVGLAVGAAELLEQILPAEQLELLVAVAFIAIGIWVLRSAVADEEEDDVVSGSTHSAFLTSLWLFFVMEMGDKTQLATLTLATGLSDALGVFLGATLALIVANLPALWLGHRFAAKLPRALLNRISGGLFIVIGVALMIRIGVN